MSSRRWLLISFLVGSLGLTGCGGAVGQNVVGSPTSPPIPTPLPLTPTPEPLAARVNGEPLSLADFDEEVARFEAAQVGLGIDLATLGDYRMKVLQLLVDRRLLAQGARANGVVVDEAALSREMETLASDLGSTETMDDWLVRNGYTMSSFKSSLSEEMLAAEMVGKIVAGVPVSAEQVHARHILVASREDAERLGEQIIAGADFAELAQAVSLDLSTRPAGGDLGWFPRGYLTAPEVETVAFALQPGELSEVVESKLGYHIVQTIEREDHPLSPDALQQLRQRAVEDWLASQRATAAIEILVAP